MVANNYLRALWHLTNYKPENCFFMVEWNTKIENRLNCQISSGTKEKKRTEQFTQENYARGRNERFYLCGGKVQLPMWFFSYWLCFHCYMYCTYVKMKIAKPSTFKDLFNLQTCSLSIKTKPLKPTLLFVSYFFWRYCTLVSWAPLTPQLLPAASFYDSSRSSWICGSKDNTVNYNYTENYTAENTVK